MTEPNIINLGVLFHCRACKIVFRSSIYVTDNQCKPIVNYLRDYMAKHGTNHKVPHDCPAERDRISGVADFAGLEFADTSEKV